VKLRMKYKRAGYYVAVACVVGSFIAIILVDFHEVHQYLVPALLAFFVSLATAAYLTPNRS
jgi:predicted neutral ceramidase superfamily lipid hydrolase